jgi:hypothetical protein
MGLFATPRWRILPEVLPQKESALEGGVQFLGALPFIFPPYH